MHARFNFIVALSAAALLAGCEMTGGGASPTPTASPTPSPTSAPQTMAFAATLTGDQEAPPVTTDGSGTATFSFDPQTNVLSYDITFSGLSGPVTIAHFHNGAVGVAGGIVFNISDDFRARLKQIKGDMVRRAAEMLTAATLESAKTLLTLQNDKQPPAVRLGAARAVVALGVKLRESAELEERIAELEQRMDESDRDINGHSRR